MSKIDKEKQIPNTFYKKLDDPQDTSILERLESYSAIKTLIEHEESRRILAKLARNINLIISEYPENHVKRCRDINYWFHEKIKTCNTKCDADLSSDSTTVFNDIKWEKENGERVCERKENPYSSENAKLMKDLDDYCEIRDNNGCNALKNKNECLNFNKYIRERKEYFSSQKRVTCKTSDCNKNDYTIDASCTLNDMDLTFPEINCEALYKKEELLKPVPASKERSPLEIGFFIIVSFILFYLFILFLEKFTPVGSIIHRFRRRKYDLKKNIERVNDDDRYSLYHSDTVPSDTENKHYYIEYARPHN
ncbi:VIR protein [Plasmodium vivax]|uniref:VIR protein n=1 Tax=Plasmodium vivax TaxID=5855 RepID=A0A1G4ECV5_PLAVI|nr:VIR protein [Plasmodium vivax]